MTRRFRVSLLLTVLLVSVVAGVQFIRPINTSLSPESSDAGNVWESRPQDHYTDLTITPDPSHPTWNGNLTYDGNLTSYAYFEYSEKSGEFTLYNFSIPTKLVGDPPEILSVDFNMRYNTTGANTADSPDDEYRIVYRVSPDTTPQVLVDWRKDTYTYLYVDGFDNSRTDWTRIGASPYLSASDYPTNYIHESMGVLLRPDGDGTYTDWTGTYLDMDEEFIVTNEAVGTGDGSTTVFYLDYPPLIRDTDRVYLNGEQTRDYSISFNTGQITFTTAPAGGVAITADYKYVGTYVYTAAANKNQSATFEDASPPLPTGELARVRVTIIARNTLSSDEKVRLPLVIGGTVYDPEYTVTDEAVGTGDGSTTVFYLDNYPALLGTDIVYLDGVKQTRKNATHDNDYAIDYATGEITFTTAPAGGVAITADYKHGYGIQKSLVPQATYQPLWCDWQKNPATGLDWTWGDVNALVAGIRTEQFGPAWTGEIRVAQMYVQVFFTAATIGDFSLADIAAYDGGKVYLEVKAKTVPGEAPLGWPSPRDSVRMFVYDGAKWTDIGSITPDETLSWKRSLDISSRLAYLNTTAKINNAKVYLVKTITLADETRTDRIEIDAVRLRVLNKDFPEEPQAPFQSQYTWTNQTEPNDGSWDAWSWTDVNNINFTVETSLTLGSDPGCGFYMYEAWVTVNLPNATMTVRPMSTADYALSPQPTITIRPDSDGTKKAWTPAVTMRPDGDGTYTAWTGTYADWNEEASDGNATYVSATATNLQESSTLSDPSPPSTSVDILKVAVTIVGWQTTGNEKVGLMLVIGATAYLGTDAYTLSKTAYEQYSSEWFSNPATGSAWTWLDLIALEAGVKSEVDGTWDGELRVTQLFVDVFVGTTLRPDGDGTYTAWTGTYADWDDEIFDGEATKVSTPISGLYESSTLSDSIAAGNIMKVRLVIIAKTEIVGEVRLMLVIGGTRYEASSAETLESTWRLFSSEWATNPAGGAWSWVAVNALEAGVKSEGFVLGAAIVSQLYLEVLVNQDYTFWDETSANGDTDFVATTEQIISQSSNLTDPVHPTWQPARVRLVVYAKYDTPTDEYLILMLVVGGAEYQARLGWNQTYERWTLTTSYEKYSYDWGVNPATNAPWTWTEIDDLEAGVSAKMKGSWKGQIRVTQLYVEISGPRYTVDVMAEDVVNLWGYSFVVYYDTTWLTFTGYCFSDPIRYGFPSTINDTGGYAVVSHSIGHPAEGIKVGFSGNITLATLVFLVEDRGRSDLELQDTSITDPGGFGINNDVYDGYLRNTFFSDFDCDGDVDFDDFMAFAASYLKTSGQPGFNPDADYDNDGDVDFDDFMVFASEYLKSVP